MTVFTAEKSRYENIILNEKNEKFDNSRNLNICFCNRFS